MSDRGRAATSALLATAVAARVTPGAVVEAGDASGVRWRAAAGRHTYAAGAPTVHDDTIYDLASLTKVIATGTLAMVAVAGGALALDTRVASRRASFTGGGRETVTVEDLLGHASGLPAHRPYYRHVAGRSGFISALDAEPLVYAPRSRSEYTDLGFMLLAFLLEDALEQPFGAAFAAFAESTLGAPALAFAPAASRGADIAPTEVDAWRGRVVSGEVHDANAAALGGAAGHAGLFGTAAGVGAFARWFMTQWFGDARASLRREATRWATPGAVPGSSRALAWDTMRPTSSCGPHLSPRAIGHTGFTGTSLWIDPDRDLYVVLLSNRVHPWSEGTTDGIRDLRRAVHGAIAQAWAP